MKIVNKTEFEELMKEYPNGGIVFAEHKWNAYALDLMVTSGEFGARCVVPSDDGIYSFDWNIKEYKDNELFVVYDNNDILQMIQTLVSGLKLGIEEDDE